MKCSICGRERRAGEIDYNPVQWLQNKPLGWFSGDGEFICPEDMKKLMEAQL